jgi:rod shape-determining protein MreC
MLFTWFMLGGFIFLFSPPRLTSRFQLAFARIFSAPLSVGRGISLAARSRLIADVVNRREYDQLQNHLANVTQQRDELQRKVDLLTGLHTNPDWKRMNIVLADIITASDRWRNELIINRGEIDGLRPNQFVLGDNSVVGKVSEVFPRTARVKLFTDPTSKIAVNIARLNVPRIMQGTGHQTANILQLQVEHRIRKDDPIVAQKEPGFLDVAMIIGRVARCERDDQNPTLWDVTVEPVCNIDELSTVAVIVASP